MNKILKLAVTEDMYFKIFEKILEQIVFMPDVQSIVKLSMFKRIAAWFKDQEELLSEKKILVIFGLLLSIHSKMEIFDVYQVAIKSNLLTIRNSMKECQGEELPMVQSNQIHEHQITRVVLNQWNFIEYYIKSTLNYCKKARIITGLLSEDESLEVRRIQSPSSFLTFSQTLSQAIKRDNTMHSLIFDYNYENFFNGLHHS